jgi:penicillin-binding protein 1A
VTPYFISEIDDRDGKPVYQANPARACRTCAERLLDTRPPGPPPANASAAPGNTVATAGSAGSAPATSGSLAGVGDAVLPADAHGDSAHPPVLAPQVIEVRNDYLVTSLMQDVVKRGTGAAAAKLGRTDLAGKTGSTNDHRDAWFVGFNSNLVTSVWVGFDDFGSLGKGEFGAKAALPIWMSYMGTVLKDQPAGILPMPPGITTVQIDRSSGLPAGADDTNVMSEYFKVEDVDRLRNQANQQQEDQDQQHAYDIF